MKGQEKKTRGRPAKRGHTPFGYRINNGKAVVNEQEAEQLRQIFTGYLSGLSYIKAAKEVGLDMTHSSVKNLLRNQRYLGNYFYPAIIDKQTFEAVEEERLRRLESSPIKHFKRGAAEVRPIQTEFLLSTHRSEQRSVFEQYSDPFQRAEYVYSQILTVDKNQIRSEQKIMEVENVNNYNDSGKETDRQQNH